MVLKETIDTHYFPTARKQYTFALVFPVCFPENPRSKLCPLLAFMAFIPKSHTDKQNHFP